MYAVDFDYEAPTDLNEAIALLHESDSAMALAGGQSLIQAANLREARPSLVVDLGRLLDLKGIEVDDSLRVGAGEAMSAIEQHPLVQRHSPLLVDTLRTVGSVAVRNRATLGGSAAWADPTSQVPATLLALDAVLVVQGRTGQRRLKADGFFMAQHATVLDRGDIIISIEIPLHKSTAYGLRLVRRTSNTWPIAGCAAFRHRETVRFGLFGASTIAVLAHSLDDVISMMNPIGDAKASAEYRQRVLPVLAERALRDVEGGRTAKGVV